MVKEIPISRIKSVFYRRVLNSHVQFTNEFGIELENSQCGVASSPQGETISIYEEKVNTVEPKRIVETISREQINVATNQKRFDDYLQIRMPIFGRNNCYALSLAFFNATGGYQKYIQQCKEFGTSFPNLCLNILNGGKHAYTNPVLSDFSEYLLVPKSSNIEEIIYNHSRIQNKIKEKFTNQNKVVINGNLVNKFSTCDNRKCVEFLLNVLNNLNLTSYYDLMIDASAGDLWSDGKYQFSLTDNSLKESNELYTYWMSMIKEYNIKFLEDPFYEKDYESWRELTATRGECNILGDNLYSSDAQKIQEGADKKYTNGTIVKPNQAGTISSAVHAIETSQSNNHIVVTSHRSISTESIFLSTLTYMYKVKYIKIGPLYTDYSSIIRLNELLRLIRN